MYQGSYFLTYMMTNKSSRKSMKVSSLRLTLMHIYNNISVRLLNKPIANGSPSIQVNFFSSEDDRGYLFNQYLAKSFPN